MQSDPVDVTSWVVVSQEPGGAEPKDWLARAELVEQQELPWRDLWLYKPVKTGEAGSPAGEYRRFDDVAELVSSWLASLIGLTAAETRLAVRGGVSGVISRMVAPPGWEMHYGDTILSEIPGYVSCAGDRGCPGSRGT